MKLKKDPLIEILYGKKKQTYKWNIFSSLDKQFSRKNLYIFDFNIQGKHSFFFLISKEETIIILDYCNWIIRWNLKIWEYWADTDKSLGTIKFIMNIERL